LYLKGIKDGELERFSKTKSFQISIRLLRTTTFKDLKLLACSYWGLEESSYSIRAPNFALVEYFEYPVETLLKDQKMKPEFWLIHDDINANKSLTEPNDYFTEDSSKKQLKGASNRNQELGPEGKAENYKKFLNHFEGIKKFMPKVPMIDESHEFNRLQAWGLNIFTLIIVAALVTISLVIHYTMGDYSNRYWIAHQVQKTLVDKFSE